MIAFLIPIKAPSTPNLREHWSARAKRAAAQKRAARVCCPKWTDGPALVVSLTRVSPRELDDDNLAGAMKSIRDAIATWLRIDDGSPLVEWKYKQDKGEPCVRVVVYRT